MKVVIPTTFPSGKKCLFFHPEANTSFLLIIFGGKTLQMPLPTSQKHQMTVYYVFTYWDNTTVLTKVSEFAKNTILTFFVTFQWYSGI